MIHLFVLPFTLFVVLASSATDQHFFEILALCKPPHQDWGQARAAGNYFARDDKDLGPQLGEKIPGEKPRETAET
jgi:hypothetical protein